MDSYEVIKLSTGASSVIEAYSKAEAAIKALNSGLISEDAYAGIIFHHKIANNNTPVWYDGYYIRNMGRA